MPRLNGIQSLLKHLSTPSVPNTILGLGDTVITLNMTDKVPTFSGRIFQSGEADTKHINKSTVHYQIVISAMIKAKLGDMLGSHWGLRRTGLSEVMTFKQRSE